MNLPTYKSFEDEDNSLSVRMWFSEFDDDKYKQNAYINMRERLGYKLLDFIDRFKSPCVVEIIETRKQQYHPEWQYQRGEQITISAKIYNVQHHQVVVPVMNFKYAKHSEEEKKSIKDNIRKILGVKSK